MVDNTPRNSRNIDILNIFKVKINKDRIFNDIFIKQVVNYSLKLDITTHDSFFLNFGVLGLVLASSTLTLGLALAGLGHVAGVPVPVVLPFSLFYLYFSLLFLYKRFTKNFTMINPI